MKALPLLTLKASKYDLINLMHQKFSASHGMYMLAGSNVEKFKHHKWLCGTRKL